MASGKTDAHEAAVINHFLRGTTETTKTAYLALFSVAPGESTAGTELAASNGYAREAIGLGVPSDGESVNAALITFTANGADWLEVVGHGVCDALTGGVTQYYEDSVAGPTLLDGDSYEFAIGAVTVAET